MNTIDKILLGVVGALITFTITMVVIFCVYQSTPDTLIECVFGLCGGEAFITFAIWWVKKKANRRSKNGTDKTETNK